MTSFASDNNSGVHPDIFDAMIRANEGHTIAYGDDRFTESAVRKFKDHFGEEIEVFFVFNGTAGNVLGLTSVANSYHAVICSEKAHMNIDECGAPEKFSGCKLLPVETPDGKIDLDGIKKQMKGIGFEHHVQPRVVSVTQATELGTVYTTEEIRVIADYSHENELYLHMDGARLSNAAVCLGTDLRAITADAGVDVLTFGGTKNGMMYGEAVVFFNPDCSKDFKYIRKQGMQLGSKMRFISAQFEAFLSNDLWRRNAEHSNRIAQILYAGLQSIQEIRITQEVQTNAVFAVMPRELIPVLKKKYFFYDWNEDIDEVRWMTSFDTTEEDINCFVDALKEILG